MADRRFQLTRIDDLERIPLEGNQWRPIRRALGVTGFTIIENNGLGQSVKQVHFHVIPRTDGGPLPPPPPGFYAKREDLEAMAAKIRTAIGWTPR